MVGGLRRTAGAVAIAILLAVVPNASAKLSPGDLLVADDDVVWQVKRSGAVSAFAESPQFGNLSAVAFTPQKVIVTDEGTSKIFSVSKKGNVSTLVGQGLANPFGVDYSGLHGLIVADYDLGTDGALLRIRGHNNTQVLADGGFFQDPIGLASAANGTPFVIEQDFFDIGCSTGNNCGGVIRILPNGDQAEFTSAGLFDDPTAGTVGADRAIWVSDQDGPTGNEAVVVRVSPGGDQLLIAADPSITGNGIALDFRNNPIVTTDTGVSRIEGIDNLVEIAPINSNDLTGVSVVPPKCGGKWATIVGTQGPETIRASKGKDVIAALGGDDTVRAGGKKDLVCGGGGDDELKGDSGKDLTVGGGGNDKCVAERERSC